MAHGKNPDANMIGVEEARHVILNRVRPTEVREVPAWLAAGLPLAADVATDIDLAPFANSAMDGYALHSEDLAAAADDAPVTLDVVGHEAAGHVFEGPVAAGQAVRIMTGAPMPEGLDAVVKYEVVEVLSGDGNEGSRVAFRAPARPGENVRAAGLEAGRDNSVMAAGEVVTPAGAGLLANAGHALVPVHRAPRVGVISLGTELVDAAATPHAARSATSTRPPSWPPRAMPAPNRSFTASRPMTRSASASSCAAPPLSATSWSRPAAPPRAITTT